MSSQHEPVEARPAASAELSLDISRVVSRVMNGEAVDTAGAAEVLAAKYPILGMTGAMIEEAISRAAGMVGMIRAAPTGAEADPEPVHAGVDAEAPATHADTAEPDPIEAEFGALDFALPQAANDQSGLNGGAAASIAEASVPGEHPGANGHDDRDGGLLAKGASAFRRAFFRR